MRIANYLCLFALSATATLSACSDDFAQVTDGEIADIAPLQFQQTLVGRTSQAQFRLRNNGDGDLIFDNIELVDASPYITFADSFVIQLAGDYGWQNAGNSQSFLQHPAFALRPDGEIQGDLVFAPTTQDPQCPGGNPGVTCGRLIITSDDRDESTLEVNITLNQSAGTISVDPTFMTFPDLETVATESFTITNVGAGPLTGITVVDPGVSGLTLAETTNRPEPFTLNVSDSSTYDVTFSPVAGVDYCPEGLANCTLGTIRINSNDSRGTVVTITVAVGSGNRPVIAVSRDRIEYLNASVGNPEEQTVDVSNTGGANLTWNVRIDPVAVRGNFAVEVGGTAIPPSGANIAQPIAPDNSQTVAITLAPTTEDSIAGQLVITSNAAGSPTRVDLFGGAPAPDLDVEPTQLQFHEVAQGESDSLQIVLTNSGRARLNLTSGTVTGASASEFTVTPALAGQAIATGGRLLVTITYDRPGDDISGLDTATLQIVSDALPPNGTKNVPLFAYHGATALPPTAEIDTDPDEASFPVGEPITLDATASAPPEGGSLPGSPFTWVLSAAPATSTAELSSSFGDAVTLTPDVAGTYTVLLTVTAIIDATTNTQAQRSINLLVTE